MKYHTLNYNKYHTLNYNENTSFREQDAIYTAQNAVQI